ncbi:glucosaminidase domain-containing protein [Micropruina sonneratiae]|uniref:glucosaminidase domain-containing protein n=1 Tax=Micropruina sonneratiae TaxID=2986940 RepID=UPI002226CC2D|nr:glucosaminidase domain-containing protein [Micropruina sp. KQZ13P-5]MCW3158732.1 glucosaminidase domain-containing protein [Micropruina sp. KQZ13P-5]
MTHPTLRLRASLLALAVSLTGLVGGTSGTSESVAAVNYEAFIAKAAKAAAASKKTYGVPRAVTIAQAILESSWGTSGLTTGYHNYFGIKCGAIVSPHQRGCVALASYEYVNGKKKKYVSRFRTYSSMSRSFLDHGRLLNYADRYNKAFKYTNNPDQFIREVHKAGYATDPNYSTLVISLMKKWNLYRFDAVSKPAVDPNLAVIRSWVGVAQRNQSTWGVPASITLAQALYHSASGKSTLATKAKNYFSMTCAGGKGSTAKGCLKLNGTKYRTYATVNDSFTDRSRVLATTKRYAKAMKQAKLPKHFLIAIKKAGWSSSSSYVDKVYAYVTKYNLKQYDLLIHTTLKKGTRSAKVQALQQLLNRAGSKVGTTGYFGTDTFAAVKKFQKKAGVSVSGRADPLTLTRITPDIRKGWRGRAVAALNALLKSRGYSVSSSGFQSRTEKSVKALQKKYRLPQTGIVSVRTWGVLFG